MGNIFLRWFWPKLATARWRGLNIPLDAACALEFVFFNGLTARQECRYSIRDRLELPRILEMCFGLATSKATRVSQCRFPIAEADVVQAVSLSAVQGLDS